MIKNYISSILNIRERFYQSKAIPFGKTLSKDSDSGNGRNSYFFRYLMKVKKYRTEDGKNYLKSRCVRRRIDVEDPPLI